MLPSRQEAPPGDRREIKGIPNESESTRDGQFTEEIYEMLKLRSYDA